MGGHRKVAEELGRQDKEAPGPAISPGSSVLETRTWLARQPTNQMKFLSIVCQVPAHEDLAPGKKGSLWVADSGEETGW